MKIAILICLKATDVCTGAACFKAFNNRIKSFAEYKEIPTLCAFFHCGGCGIDRINDPNINKKMQRLQSEGVETIHIGKCVGEECEHRAEITAMLERYGMKIVFGTH